MLGAPPNSRLRSSSAASAWPPRIDIDTSTPPKAEKQGRAARQLLRPCRAGARARRARIASAVLAEEAGAPAADARCQPGRALGVS